MISMDSIFLLEEADRPAFLRRMIQSVGCSYVCLWLYLPQPSNLLRFHDGLYQETSSLQPSSSSGGLARRLFDVYSESVNYLNTGGIPGFAFKNNVAYMELKEHDFQRMASSQVQLHFYQEAGIKTVVFMRCALGEIELGMRDELQIDLNMEMNNIVQAIDLSNQAASALGHQPADQSLSSPSSSLKSLSFESSDQYSPLMFGTPTTSLAQEPQREVLIQESHVALKSVPMSHQQAIQELGQIQNFPITTESADAAMTKAILAVLSSSSTSPPPQITTILTSKNPVSQKATPFQRYRKALAPISARSGKNSFFKRAVGFYSDLDLRRRQRLQIQETRPTSNQLHHMLKERKRREKINESFQLLKSLLPSGSKKDKVSVLNNIIEYLSSLISQVEELGKRNQILEERLSNQKEPKIQDSVEGSSSSSSSYQERVRVEITRVTESTSEARILSLTVTVRGESRMLDFVSRILEFLRQQRNLSLLSVESSTRMAGPDSVHGLLLRLRIEEDEFDEPSFQEAVRRVVDDSIH